MAENMINAQSGFAALARSWIGDPLRLIGQSFSAQGIIFMPVLGSLAVYLLLISATENSLDFYSAATSAFIGISMIALMIMFFFSFYDVAVNQKPKIASIALAKTYWRDVTNPRRLLLGMPVIIVFSLYIVSYVEIKNHIPVANPYSWDELFYQWDKFLHFGVSPWEWVHPLFSSSPYLVLALNINYLLWFVFIWLVMVPIAFVTKNSPFRTQFLLTFFLVWSVGGSVLATVFSSAGPAFYAGLGHSPDPYGPLMIYLHEVNNILPIWAISLQDQMWQAYSTQGVNFGISAMPSMHNAIALLFVIGGWHLNKKFAGVLIVHGLLVFVASFYLGWHYAIDAYFGWAVTLIAWKVSGPIANWWHQRPEVKNFDAYLEQKND